MYCTCILIDRSWTLARPWSWSQPWTWTWTWTWTLAQSFTWTLAHEWWTQSHAWLRCVLQRNITYMYYCILHSSEIIWESSGYCTNLPVSSTDHQISWIKFNFDLFLSFSLELGPCSPKIKNTMDYSLWGINDVIFYLFIYFYIGQWSLHLTNLLCTQ